jgi:predicted phosphate transport protein (TIGR00153 family)
MLARFLPRDEQFFTYFEAAATNATDSARALVDLFTEFSDVERKVWRMRDLEHRGDEITHNVFSALNRTFVTPLDREDIRALASDLDNFVDYIEEAAKRVWIYRVEGPTEPALRLARILDEQAESLAKAIPLLENAKQRAAVLQHTVEINRLENEADDVLHQALSGLYDAASDIPSLIKAIRWGELYQLLEDATDQAEDVANTLETIVSKYA